MDRTNQHQIVFEVRVPDLGLEGWPIRLAGWLVPVGQHVLAGDPLAELVVADALVDLASPINGYLVEKCVEEGQVFDRQVVVARLRLKPPASD